MRSPRLLPWASSSASQSHEAGEGVGGDVDQLEAGREVAVGVGADQAAVFLAGRLAEAPAALAAVAADPLVQIAAEGDRAALLQLAAVAVGLALALEPLRLLVGAGIALSLPRAAAVDAGVADRLPLAVHALEDAGRLGLDEPPLVAAALLGRWGRRILGNAHEIPPREPGGGPCERCRPVFRLADKT